MDWEKTQKELELIKISEDAAPREYVESIINTVREPLIVLDQDLRVVTASRSFYKVFKVTPEETMGQLIYDLGNKQWDIPKLRELLETILPQKATFDNYEVEHDFADIGRRVMLLNARQIQRVSGKERIILLAIEDITKRKQAEEALRESRELYQTFLESTMDMVLLKDDELRHIMVNKRLLDFMGKEKNEIIGKTDAELLPQSIAQVCRQTDMEVIQSGAIVMAEEPMHGGIYETRKFPVSIGGGKVGVGAYIRDITDRKLVEEELKEKDKFVESIVQSSAIATFVINSEHKVIYWNMACEDLTGIKSKDLLGTSDHWKAFYDHPRLCVADIIIENKFNEMTNLYEVYARSVLMPDGIHAEDWYPNLGGKNRYIVFDAAPIRDDNGKLIAAIETLQDITERKRAEEQLKYERQRFSFLSENAPFGMAMIDKDGNFVYINPKFKEIFGYSLSEIPDGRTWFKKAYPDSAYRQTVIAAWVEDLKAVGPGEKRPRVFTVTCKDGKEKIINLISVQMETGAHIMTCEDITSRKHAEEELQHTMEKLRKSLAGTIQALSSTIETRDPYTAGHQRKVSNLARTIAKEMGLPNDTVENIRMAGIIHDIGKISVPAEILSKPGKISDIEMSLVRVHSQSGYDILKDVGLPYPIAEIVLQHHERLDGSGYPQGLKNGQILLEAKIISVADVVEAIFSFRPYRPGFGIDVALKEIEKNKCILYDEKVVEACVKLFREKGFTFEPTAS